MEWYVVELQNSGNSSCASAFKNQLLRDSVTRVFAPGFLHESVSPQPQSIPLRLFRIFRKFAEIFASQGAPPISTTPASNFSTSLNSIVNTGGKHWEQLSNCWQLKMNLKKKNVSICLLYFPKVSKRNNANVSDWRFFHLPLVSTTPVVHL
jgi:hypothetical protein